MSELLNQANFEKYDVTLRDGAQDGRSRSSVEKKLESVRLFDDWFDYIEGGWPGANRFDTKLFKVAQTSLQLRHAKLVAFGSTAKPNTNVASDHNLQRLLGSEAEVVTLVGKTWEQNIRKTLRTDYLSNLRTITDSIKFLVDRERKVFFDAEHWFDSYRQNPTFAFQALDAALQGGASRLVLCDTRGAATDKFVFEATRAAIEQFPDAIFGIHVHNDGDLGTINTIRALEAGVKHVQATVNGVGERPGNANWCSLLPTAEFKYGINSGLDLTGLTSFAHTVAAIWGIPVPLNAPYVGYLAFAHKGGLHASGQQKDPEAYEHIRPEWVGNKRVYIFSEQGGSAHLEFMLKKHGFTLSRKDPDFKLLLEKMKEYTYFGDAQEFLFLYENRERKQRPFSVLDGSGVTDISPLPPKAQVNVRVNGGVYYEEATGDGPINAFDIALKQALSTKYPEVNNIKLKSGGYRINLLNGNATTASEVEVSVTVEFNGKEINSIARGPNQNRAGETALADAYNCCIISYRKSESLVLASRKN